jgi:hypothetical protein
MAFQILITLILIALRLVAAVLQAGIQYINVLSVRVVGNYLSFLRTLIAPEDQSAQITSSG